MLKLHSVDTSIGNFRDFFNIFEQSFSRVVHKVFITSICSLFLVLAIIPGKVIR